MSRRFAAAALAVLSCMALSGCLAPMGRSEAQSRAARSLGRYCHEHACGPVRLVGAQKIGARWLVDFDAPQSKYAVAVDNGGNTDVSVWDKSP